jgi:hypothetical protein
VAQRRGYKIKWEHCGSTGMENVELEMYVIGPATKDPMFLLRIFYYEINGKVLKYTKR